MADLMTILQDGRDVDMSALRSYLATEAGKTTAALLAQGTGLKPYMTKAAMDGDTDEAVGQLAYVYANNGSTSDPANSIYQWSGASWVTSPWFLAGLAAVVQPLVDAAAAAATAAQAAAADARATTAVTVKSRRMLNFGLRPPSVTIQFGDGGILPLADADGRTLTLLPSGVSETVISASSLWGERALSIGLIEGEVMARVYRDPDGYVREAYGMDGGHFVATPTGLARANAGATSWGARALSPGPIDGEIVVRVARDSGGYIREAWGEEGSHWLATPSGLARANAKAFAGAGTALTFTAEPYVSGMQERLSYQSSSTKLAQICILMGQSNGDGQNNELSDSLVSGAPVYPGNALMLQGGPRYTTASGAEVLVPLVETVVGGNGSFQQETPLSGWVNHFIRDHHAKFGIYPTVVGLSVAQGDRPYNGNKRGSDVYRRLEAGLPKIVAALKAQGFTAFQTVVGYVGSEGDFGQTARMTPTRFAGQLRQLRRQVGETVRRITGEAADPLLIVLQPSNTSADPFVSPVREGMRRQHGREGVICAGPSYQFSMAGADVIHRDNLGKYGSGIALARATVAEVLGMTWHGVRPQGDSGYWLSDTRLAVDMDIMGTALTLDTTGTVVATAGLANAGFAFADGSGAPPAIVDVTASAQTVTITLSAKPTGPRPRLSYAGQRNPGNSTTDGPIVGARGILRDDSAYTAIAGSAPQYLWADAFIVDLPPRV